MGMGKRAGRKPAPTNTNFGKWLKSKLEDTNTALADLARAVDSDYSHLWKIVQCDLVKYKTSSRPGYEVTEKIGAFFGNVQEALNAAGYDYQSPELPESQKVTDSAGTSWTLLHNLSDPHTEFSLSPEAARVLVALGLLAPEALQPQPQGTEGQE